MSAQPIYIIAHSLVAATFAWLGLMVLIEGNRRTAVARWFAFTMLAFALFHYNELAAPLFTSWSPFQSRLPLWLIGGASVGCLAVAVVITRDAIAPNDWQCYRWQLIELICWAVLVALACTLFPDQFFGPARAGENFHRGKPLFLFSIVQVQLSLGLTLLIYLRAQRLWWKRHRLFIWFILAAFCAQVAALLLQLSVLDVPFILWPPESIRETIRQVGLLGFLICAGLTLKAMTMNRELLGRPIRATHLLIRWLILLIVLTVLVVLELPPSKRGFELLGVTIIVPLLWVVFEWNQHRMFRQTIEHYRRYAYESINGWPTARPTASEERCKEKAQQIFDTLVHDLHADACSLHLQAGPHEPAFDLIYQTASRRADEDPDQPSAYYLREVKVEIDGQQLGSMKLRGPKGIAYSALELNLAEACAYHIAGLYLDSRQVGMLEDFVMRSEDQRTKHNQRLQRILHDRVLGNLDVIHKAVYLLAPTDQELIDEIRESVRESESLIRDLLRGELADVHPPILLREGLIAALRAEVLAHYRSDRYQHIKIVIEPGNLNDTKLNACLGEDLNRKLYAALEEIIRNAIKYADGGTRRMISVQVTFYLDARGLRVTVADDGVGFVPELATSRSRGLGLSYYEVLLRTAGGTLTVKSQAAAGTTVAIDIPSKLLLGPQQSRKPSHAPTLIAHSPLEWHRLMFESEQHQGGRLLVKDQLSDLTRPLETTIHYHGCRSQDEHAAQQLVDVDVERQQLFRNHVRYFPFKEIVDQRRLIDYIMTGKTNDGYDDVGKASAREHIRHIIQLLKMYDNYHLGLSNLPFETNFAVKPDYAVLVEQRVPEGKGKLAGFYEGICDTHPSTIAAFTRRFEEAWSTLPEEFRAKKQVIAHLEHWLLEAEHVSSSIHNP